MDLIIGAGITGLSYAAFTKNDYMIVEKEAEYGGYCRTIKQDGFTWDYSGHFFHFKNPEIKQYVFENMRSQKIYNVKKISSIYHNDSYIDFPFQKNIHQLPKKDFLDCLYDLAVASGEPSSTFKGMLKNNYGNGISDRFLIPYNEKLYACDLDELDADAMGRFFPHADLKSIIRNFKETNAESYNDQFVYPEGGAIEYVHAVASRVDQDKIRLNTSVKKIDLANRVAVLSDGESIKYERLVSTIPFPKLMELTAVEYKKEFFNSNKVAVFNLGFDLPSANNNHWIYYPDKEYIFYRLGFYDNIFGADKMSMYAEIGYSENTVLKDESQLLERVMKDLKTVGIVDNHKLVSYKFLIMNPAYVHINSRSTLEFTKQVAQLERNDVYTAGRYGAWRYCSIEDNIIEAKELAGKLMT